MDRLVGRFVPLILLLALGISIGGFGPDPGFDSPTAHYNGDLDDAGHVGKLRSHGVDAAVTDTRPTGVPSTLIRRWSPQDIPAPPAIAHEPLGSRAPPA
jgi:hypothetical protein